LNVDYKGNVIGEYRADYLVDEKVVVEIKAIKRISEIQEAQLINYLKGTGYKVGLLINFGAKSLEHIRRVL
jgi:GxxExxY protein